MSKILDEALADAKALQETAIETARTTLVEAISPQIREFFDSQMRETGDVGGLPPELSDIDPGMLEKLLMVLKQQHAMEPSDDDLGMGLGMGDEEEESPVEGMYENDDKDEDDEDKEEKEMSESGYVKIDEADLAKAWAEVVKEESLDEAQVPSPSVSGEFADAQNPNSNAKGGLGEKSAPGDRGLEDKETEEMWKDEVPPASQDWSVKENYYRKQLAQLKSINSGLKAENKKLNLGVEQLHRRLAEVNVFNSKLLHTTKLLQNANLTAEQRLNLIEAFDSAETLREVELVYKSLSESLKIAGMLNLTEGKQKAKTARSSRYSTSASGKMMNEEVERENKNVMAERFQQLAGLKQVLGE